LVRALTLDLQLRQLSIDLFAFADEGTATAADDLPFAALPQSCVRTLGVKQTTYADATVAAAAATLNATADCIFIDAFDD